MIAYAWRSGLIGIAEKCPKNALPIAHAPSKQELEGGLAGCARLSYSNEWLVPGLPEAKPSDDHVGILVKFSKLLQERLTAPRET